MKRGELAKASGCNAETIRYYEKKGVLLKPGRDGNGYRNYADEDLRRLRFIRHCRELGFTMNAVEDLLSLIDSDALSCKAVKQAGTLHLEGVRRQITQLKRMEVALSTYLKACSGENTTQCSLIDALFPPV